MHHRAIISYGRAESLTIHGQCSCGTGGDFGSSYDAGLYLSRHLQGLTGISTGELVDETLPPTPDAPAPVPEVEAGASETATVEEPVSE